MRLRGYKLGLEMSLLTKKNKRDRIFKNAKRGAANPWPIDKIKSMQPISIEAFYENIGNIFPTLLEEVSKGHGLPSIAVSMGFHSRFFERIVERHGRLGEMVKKARQTKLDDTHFQ